VNVFVHLSRFARSLPVFVALTAWAFAAEPKARRARRNSIRSTSIRIIL